MGVVAFECLTGKLPFSGKTLTDIVVQICTEKPIAPSMLSPVPAGFDAWFAKATHKDAMRRFSSAEEMAATLSEILTLPREVAASPARPLAAAQRVRHAVDAVRGAASTALGWLQARPWRELPALPSLRVTPSRKVALGGAAIACLAVGGLLRVRSSELAPASSEREPVLAESDALPTGNAAGRATAASELVPSPLPVTTGEGTPPGMGASDVASSHAPPHPVAVIDVVEGQAAVGALAAKPELPGTSAAPKPEVGANESAPIASAERPRSPATEPAPNANAPRRSADAPPLAPASAARAGSSPVAKAAAPPPPPAKTPPPPRVATASSAAPARAVPAPARAAATASAPARAAQGRPTTPAPGAKRSVSDDEALFAERL
jgi:serine/threonine-protein kinase